MKEIGYTNIRKHKKVKKIQIRKVRTIRKKISIKKSWRRGVILRTTRRPRRYRIRRERGVTRRLRSTRRIISETRRKRIRDILLRKKTTTSPARRRVSGKRRVSVKRSTRTTSRIISRYFEPLRDKGCLVNHVPSKKYLSRNNLRIAKLRCLLDESNNRCESKVSYIRYQCNEGYRFINDQGIPYFFSNVYNKIINMRYYRFFCNFMS